VNSQPFVRKSDVQHRVPNDRIAGLISESAGFTSALPPLG
jgi:hypothetical protein